MSIRICIGGRIGAGKTSVANLITERYGIPRLTFVEPIRKEICAAFGVTMDDLTLPGLKERYRPLLVAWGPARNIATGDPHYWAKQLLNRIDEAIPFVADVVVDDLRRPEEFDCLRLQQWPDTWVMAWLDMPVERSRGWLAHNGVTDPRKQEEALTAVTETALQPYVEQGKFDIVLDAARAPEEIFHDLVRQLLILGVPLDEVPRGQA